MYSFIWDKFYIYSAVTDSRKYYFHKKDLHLADVCIRKICFF